MVNRKTGKALLEKVVARYEDARSNPSLNGSVRLSERDITTKFVSPMLSSLNWDIYDVIQVREEKFFPGSGVQPDFTLTDSHGKIIFIEVKPYYLEGKLDEDLAKYAENKEVRKEATTIVLTSFAKTEICVFGKGSSHAKRTSFSYNEYPNRFDELWQLLSNTKAGHKGRTHSKAWATRNAKLCSTKRYHRGS